MSSASSVEACLRGEKDLRLAGFLQYCCIFACGNQRNFRVDELYAVLDSEGLALSGCIEVLDQEESPYMFVYLPNDEAARAICSRSFTMKKIMRHWITVSDMGAWETGITQSYEQSQSLPRGSEEATFSSLQAHIHHTFVQSTTPVRFKLEIHRHGLGKGFTKTSFEQAVDMLVASLQTACARADSSGQWAGVVDLESPQVVLCFWEGGGRAPVHVGRLVQDNCGRASKLLDTFHLRNGRPFLGPTSLACDWAFLMCSLAGCQRGHLVLDPFVGSASILVSAARLGAQCVGADIDMRILTGRGGIDKRARADIADNFSHYGLPAPDLLCSSQNCRTWRKSGEGCFDAIVTDPPYGVRAGARKIAAVPDTTEDGAAGGAGAAAGGGLKTDRVAASSGAGKKRKPVSVPYSTVECLDDLLDLAAEVLVMGGKLVCFVPSSVASAAPLPLPLPPPASWTGTATIEPLVAEAVESPGLAQRYLSHPCLQRVSLGEDEASVGRGKSSLRRHLLVLRKAAPWGGARMQADLALARAARNRQDRDAVVCVRDVGAAVYKDSRRKVAILVGL